MKQLILTTLCFFTLSQAYTQGTWTWMGGSQYANDSGKYVGDSLWPSSRMSACFSEGNKSIYIFGGSGIDANNKAGLMNDLWHWNGKAWSWVSGSDTVFNDGYFEGNKLPIARGTCACYYDEVSEEFFVFGGSSFAYFENEPKPSLGYRNDFWKWNGKDWAFVSGDSTLTGPARYVDSNGLKKTPPSTSGALYWQSIDGQFNLYGGLVFDTTAQYPYHHTNEWWQYDSTGWTVKQAAKNVHYFSSTAQYPKEKGIFTENAQPGRRRYSATSTNKSGDLFLYGGDAFQNGTMQIRCRNDLWTHNGKEWAWLTGDTTFDEKAKYCKNTADINCHPSALSYSMAWVDNNDYFWMFGGSGRTDFGRQILSAYFWKWNGRHWELLNNQTAADIKGAYGTFHQADTNNWPGARRSAVTWTDEEGNFWLFGGYGYDADSTLGYLNDLWKFTPDTNFTVAQKMPYEQHLHVYPNPAQDQINIQITENATNQHLRIFNTQGQLVWQQELASGLLQVSTNDWPKGLYILQGQNANGVVEKKIIVN